MLKARKAAPAKNESHSVIHQVILGYPLKSDLIVNRSWYVCPLCEKRRKELFNYKGRWICGQCLELPRQLKVGEPDARIVFLLNIWKDICAELKDKEIDPETEKMIKRFSRGFAQVLNEFNISVSLLHLKYIALYMGRETNLNYSSLYNYINEYRDGKKNLKGNKRGNIL